MLRILTLGGLSITRDGEPLMELLPPESEALLLYLSCTGRPHQRQVLAEFLWSEEQPDVAGSNLDRTLATLREHVGPALTLSGDTVHLLAEGGFWLDAHEMEASLSRDQVDEATALYAGPFLEGFPRDEATPFGAWMCRERTRLHGMVVDALATHCA